MSWGWPALDEEEEAGTVGGLPCPAEGRDGAVDPTDVEILSSRPLSGVVAGVVTTV